MIKKRNEELGKFFELSLNLLCIAGVDAKFKRINPQFEKLLGYTEEELLTIPFIDLVHPDDRAKTLMAVSALEDGKDVVNFENRYICKDGRQLNIRWTAAPEATEGKIYAVGIDVTEERREEYFKNRLIQIRDMYITDKRKKNKFWNSVVNLLIEISQSEGGFIGEIKHSENGEPYLKIFSILQNRFDLQSSSTLKDNLSHEMEFHDLDSILGEVIKTGELVIENNLKNTHKIGENFFWDSKMKSFMGIPLHYAGKFLGMIGLINREHGYDMNIYRLMKEYFIIISSIVNSYLLERELDEAGKLNSLYKNAIDKSSIVSISDPTGKIIYANQMFCDISGYSREELIGKNHRIINSGKMPDGFFKNLWETISNGKTWQGEICNKTKTGELYWVEGLIVPYVNSKGEIDRYISIRRNITQERERKKLEMDFQNAKDSAKAKSDFLSMMSHEIRTPLNGVLSMVEILKETNLNDEQFKLINTISNSGKTLLTIVNDILDLSKIEAGKINLDIQECDLHNFISAFVEPFRFSCLEKDINFNLNLEKFSHKVYIDEGRVGQIISNLLSNAIKFTFDGEISLDLNKVFKDKDNVGITISVKDTGIGIPEDFMQKIFEPFSQSNLVGDSYISGTGLGLSISKKIVNHFGGDITVESEVGKGSIFTIQFDAKIGSKKEGDFGKNFEKKISLNLGKVTKISNILIVEDNLTNQFVIRSLVEKIGHQSFICKNGSEALIELENNSYDLILMDCQMPIINGYEATKMIRQSNKEFADIPIIALTANVIKGDDKKCFESGMNGYLTKPVSLRSLEEEINKFLSKEGMINFLVIERLLLEDFCGDFKILSGAINSYLNSSKNDVSQLITEIESEHPVAVKFLTHGLIPTTKMLGALKFATLLEEINKNPVTKNKKLIVAKIDSCYQQIEKELTLFLDSIAAKENLQKVS